MGCDIHMLAQRQNEDGTYRELDFVPFDWRSYGMFGFLADVRNYSMVPPIAEPRGLPEDMKQKDEPEDFYAWSSREYVNYDDHSHSWLSVKELAEFNYDQEFEDRRCMINGNGGCTCEIGQGHKTTFREFLGEQFFSDLEQLIYEGADRIVFWFDN